VEFFVCSSGFKDAASKRVNEAMLQVGTDPIERVRRVLIVDDDAVVLRGFRRAFEHMASEVETANTVDAALALARERPSELCIVDFQLGGQSGLELIRTLRTEFPASILVMMTGYGSMELAAQAIRAGANEVVAKPITAREIVERLGGKRLTPIETPSVDRALWEHVTRVLGDCNGNKSETARRLRKPRSWLQRFLARSAPRA
jgi:two-component system response regulator RegA